MTPVTKAYRRATEGMTIVEHLREARKRLMVALIAYFAMAVVAFIFYDTIIKWLQHPYCQVSPNSCAFYASSPFDGLTLRINIALFGGLLLASPVIFYELWRFITPGLKAREKKFVIPFLVATVGFFAGGCVVAYLTFEH